MRRTLVQVWSRHGVEVILSLAVLGAFVLFGLGYQITSQGIQHAQESFAARRAALTMRFDLQKLDTDVDNFRTVGRRPPVISFHADQSALLGDLSTALNSEGKAQTAGVLGPLLDIERIYTQWLDTVALPLESHSNRSDNISLEKRGALLTNRMLADDMQALGILDTESSSYLELTRQRLAIGLGLSVVVGLALYAGIMIVLRAQLRTAREHDYIVATAQDIIGIADMNGYFIKFNPAANRILGYRGDELLLNPFMSFVHPEDVDATTEVMKGLTSGQVVESFHNRYAAADGSYRSMVWNAVPDLVRRVIYCTGRDETERVLSEREHERMAYSDALTGLSNRAMFMASAARAIAVARRETTEVAVILFDLNGFKAVNDTYGHSRGDDVLIAVAQRVRSKLREADLVARLGGDEFTVLLEARSGSINVDAVVLKIKESVREPHRILDVEVRLSASIGFATFPHDADSAESMLAVADAAMYRDKKTFAIG